MIQISEFSYENKRFVNLLNRQSDIPHEVITSVNKILDDVKKNGDAAVKKYMKLYDDVDLDEVGFCVTEEEFVEARKRVPESFKQAVKLACDNIFTYHEKQKSQNYEVSYKNDVLLQRKYVPLNRVAVTVPGQMAPLFSTLYMNVIPAIVAKVPEIYIITKPINGKINDYILYTAEYLNIKKVYKISGAQGIAAVAYGTDKINRVDAIVGPGNNYTQMAKKLLYGQLRIDSIAGPSEIAIIADETASPKFIAADLLSQAEHGTGFEASTAFCTSQELANEIKKELVHLVNKHHLENTLNSLENYGDIFVVDSLETAINAVNMIAPEHAEVMVKDNSSVVDKLVNVGAIFVGEYSPEPTGDYFCGSNHILPTCGTARFCSGLSVQDFMRGYSVINYTKEALVQNGEYIKLLAETEGLKAHSLSVDIRL